MNKEEIESLFKKYKVRKPKEKQGQSECHECKRHNKYSLTWTSFLYEYKENYYCFEHIVNILLQQENKQLKEELKYTVPIVEHNKIVSKKLKENQKYKEVIDKAIEYIKSYKTDYSPYELSDYNVRQILDILKGV